MKLVPIHRHLHDVFGRAQTVPELCAIVLAGLGLPAALMLWSPDILTSVPIWRSALALILVADIAAGSVANFTRSTNDYYADRPRNRWVFIAIHVHVVLVALLLGVDLGLSLAVWAYTIAGAAVVNLLAASPLQTFVGGGLLAVGLSGLALYPGASPVMSAVCALFMLKVLFSFAVDHYRSATGGAEPVGTGE